MLLRNPVPGWVLGLVIISSLEELRQLTLGSASWPALSLAQHLAGKGARFGA